MTLRPKRRPSFDALPRLSRRGLLKAGAALAGLPLIAHTGSAMAAEGDRRLRLLIFFVPNGFHMPAMQADAGDAWQLPELLAPLADLKEKTTYVTGFANSVAFTESVHAVPTASMLTGVRPAIGSQLKNSISIDQLIAAETNPGTLLPSLHLTTEPISSLGQGESGYSGSYYHHVSWLSDYVAQPNIGSPEAALRTMFGRVTGVNPATQGFRSQKLVDFLQADSLALLPSLGSDDSRRVEEYLSAVSALEDRIQAQQAVIDCEIPSTVDPIGAGFTGLNEAMADVISLGFQCDTTRVVTYMEGHGASGRLFDFLGAGDPFHTLSHHAWQPSAIDQYKRITAWEVERFAALCSRLDAIDDGGGYSVLDNTVACLMSGMGEGDEHDVFDIPLVICGATGLIRNNTHVQLEPETPLANLHVTLANLFGVNISEFGTYGDRILHELLPA